MFIYHKLVVLHAAAPLQLCYMSEVHATLAVSIMPASWEVACRWAAHPVSCTTSGFSHHHSAATHHHLRHCETLLAYPWKLHACKANNYYFLYLLFKIICCMYFVLFSIVLYRTIVTVYTDNIFLHNYLWQMYQIIQLSLEGRLSSARGKSVQKYSKVKRTSYNVVRLHWTHALEAISRYRI